MPKFRYHAYSSAGRIETGAIEAVSQPDAVKRLGERGLLPFKTEAVRHGDAVRTSWLTTQLSGRLSLADYAGIARELSVLINAGLPLDQALRLMTDQTATLPVKRLIRDLVASVTAGAALSAAFEQCAKTAPAYLVSLIRAGEARGSLGPTLAEVASFLQKRADLQARVRSAFAYPLVLAATALAAVVVIITFLVPALAPLFSEVGIEPPLAFVIAQRSGSFISGSWPALLAAPVLGVWLAKHLLRREQSRLVMDRLLLRLPVVGDVVAKTNIALLARTLGTLLRNGVALVPALAMTASVVPCRPFAVALRTAADGVREGRRLGSIVDGNPDMPRLAARFISIGEEASKLEEMLLHLADISDTEAQRQTDKLMTLLPAVLTIVIGIVVGSLILSVMQAILSVNHLALR